MADQETTMNKDTLLDLIHAGLTRWESAFEHYDEHLADLRARIDR